MYGLPDEQELFDIILKPDTNNETSLVLKERFDYYDKDPVRCALEVFIRKRKALFDKKR